MNDVSELMPFLARLDSAPRMIARRKKEILKKFSWTRVSQVSNLLRLGIWLDLLKDETAAEKVFSFLSQPEFKGDWDVWSCVQSSLLFLAFSARNRGEDPSELIGRALAPGFLMNRLNGMGLERLLKHLKSSTLEKPFFEAICFLLENIVMELRIMSTLGGSDKYSVSDLELLEQRYQAELRAIAEQV